MIEYLKLENVADERGEEPAKVARTLVRLGYDLYLRFGPSRDSRSGVSFYPEHPTERMEHNIGSGDKQLTKDSQEAVIKRLGRGDTTTEGLTVLDVSPNEVSQKLVLSCDEIVELDPKPEVLKFQIELMEQDDSVCVVVIPDDVAKLPPPPIHMGGGATVTGEFPYAKINFENFVNSEKDFDERIESGKQKPHTCFIKHELRENQKRGDTWKKFIQLANNSVGKNEVTLSGYGKIYLRRVRKNPEKEILYSHEPFDHDKDENIPDGVSLIKRSAFDKAWTKIVQQ